MPSTTGPGFESPRLQQPEESEVTHARDLVREASTADLKTRAVRRTGTGPGHGDPALGLVAVDGSRSVDHDRDFGDVGAGGVDLDPERHARGLSAAEDGVRDFRRHVEAPQKSGRKGSASAAARGA